MFVVFENGGKQYKVFEGDTLKIEYCECKKGDILKFKTILLYSDNKGDTIVGSPYVKNLELSCKVLDIIKDKKIIVFKKKRRHNYRRKLGHRQNMVVLKVLNLNSDKNKVSGSADKVNTSKKNKSKNLEVTKDGS